MDEALKAVDGYVPIALAIDVSSTAYVASRRFGVTGEGRLVMVPAEAKPGDALVILPGVEVPFVMRKIEEARFEMVGDAYVYRMIDGEVLELG